MERQKKNDDDENGYLFLEAGKKKTTLISLLAYRILCCLCLVCVQTRRLPFLRIYASLFSL